MKPTLFLLFLLAPLASCAARREAQDTSPQGICARQAQDDPQVRELRMRQVSNPYLQVTLQPQLERTLKAATDRCLLYAGIGVRGGVAPLTTQ